MDPIHGYQCSKCGKSFEIASSSQQEAARSAAVCCCDPKRAGPIQVGDYVDDWGGKWKVWFVGDTYAYVSDEFRYASLEWSEPRKVCLRKLRAYVNNVDVPKPTTIADCPPGEYRKEFEDLIGDLEFFKPDPVRPPGGVFRVGDKVTVSGISGVHTLVTGLPERGRRLGIYFNGGRGYEEFKDNGESAFVLGQGQVLSFVERPSYLDQLPVGIDGASHRALG